MSFQQNRERAIQVTDGHLTVIRLRLHQAGIPYDDVLVVDRVLSQLNGYDSCTAIRIIAEVMMTPKTLKIYEQLHH